MQENFGNLVDIVADLAMIGIVMGDKKMIAAAREKQTLSAEAVLQLLRDDGFDVSIEEIRGLILSGLYEARSKRPDGKYKRLTLDGFKAIRKLLQSRQQAQQGRQPRPRDVQD